MSLDDNVDLNFHHMIKKGVLNHMRKPRKDGYLRLVAQYGKEDWSVPKNRTYWKGMNTFLQDYYNTGFRSMYWSMVKGVRAAFTYIGENGYEPFDEEKHFGRKE